MGKATPPARQLDYANLDEMLADVDSLLQNGYESAGNWTLGQATGHVAEWISYPLEGFPTPPIFMRAIFGVMKMTGTCKRMAKKILENGFKPGMPTAPDTVPEAAFTDEEGVAKLHAIVDQVKNFNGQLHKSPLFGDMDMATHIKVSLLHANHHFGYMQPKNDSTA